MDAPLITGAGNRLRGVRDRPRGAAGGALLVLVMLGILLRIVTVISVRPVTILEDNYQAYAHNAFLDPLHPAGYGLILTVIGAVTHNINGTILLQHLSGVVSALCLGAATRRVTGSAWAGLLPAGMLLLSGDVVFLEHSIMSESWEILATSVGLYATVRAIDQPTSGTRWSLLAGASLAVGAMIRSASLPLIVVAISALLLARPREPLAWWRRCQASIALAAVSVIFLFGFSAANAAFGTRFGIAPSPGWYLYARVAQFAECDRFTPPAGSSALCQKVPPDKRPTGYAYEVSKSSPAVRLTGGFGREDGLVGSWADRALVGQFGDFLATAWAYFRSYFVPSSRPARLRESAGLDPQLSFTNAGNIFFDAGSLQALNAFFGPFTFVSRHFGVTVLRRWQLIFRFGATALLITTILTLLGLMIGTRRSRLGVLLFGIGGLSLLITPALISTYSGRYTVPMSGPLLAAAGITICELWRLGRTRHSSRWAGHPRSEGTPRGPAPSAPAP